MASLTGQTIQSTYDSLLKTNDNEPLTSSLKEITDGLGNVSALQLSTSIVKTSGKLFVSGATDDQGALQVNSNGGNLLLNTTNSQFGITFKNTQSSNKKWDLSSFFNDLILNESGVNPSIVFKAGGNIAIGGTSASEKLHVYGNGLFTGTLTASNISGSNTGDETQASIKSKLGAASASQDGYLTSSDWSTFNGKQNALTNPITGTGSANSLPKFNGTTSLTNSQISDDGTDVFIVNNLALGGKFNSTVRADFGVNINSNFVIDFRTDVANPFTRTSSIGTSSNGLTFLTGSGTPTERMRINASGNLGVGTTNPTNRLHLEGTAPDLLNLTRTSVGSWLFSISATNRFGIYDLNATAERLSITSGGNVGIGTTSPNAKLHIQNQTSANTSIQIHSFGSEAAGEYAGIFLKSAATNANEYTKGLIAFRNNGTGYGRGDLYLCLNNDLSAANASLSDVKAVITSGGRVGIGTTSPLTALDVNGSINTNTSVNVNGTASNSLAAGPYFVLANSSNSYQIIQQLNASYDIDYWSFRGSWNKIANINGSTGIYVALSDVNKKKDFEESNIGLKEVMQLKPTLYRMKTDSNDAEKQLGFIAQEVKDIIPYAYSESGEGDDKFIGLQDRPIIAVLVKAIQEQQAQIEELKAKLN